MLFHHLKYGIGITEVHYIYVIYVLDNVKFMNLLDAMSMLIMLITERSLTLLTLTLLSLPLFSIQRGISCSLLIIVLFSPGIFSLPFHTSWHNKSVSLYSGVLNLLSDGR